MPHDWKRPALRRRAPKRTRPAYGRAVRELLGHTSPVTTAIYTKVADGAMRRAATDAATLR